MPSATDDAVGALRTEESVRNAIKEMQEFAGIPATGKLDDRTIKLMNTPRCGLPDKSRQTSGRRKRYSVRHIKWHRTDLTWSLRTTQFQDQNLRSYDVRYVISKALDVWSKHSKLTFAEVDSDRADILIYFHRKDHGDNFPFDGRGIILAHAFFPTGQEGVSVDVHFDADENWTTSGSSDLGTNLFMVAAHEIGHSLGLSHSNVEGALMYPWYTEMKNGFEYELPEDDRLGIQSLYGARDEKKRERIPHYPHQPTYYRPTTTTTTTTTTTMRPVTRPHHKYPYDPRNPYGKHPHDPRNPYGYYPNRSDKSPQKPMHPSKKHHYYPTGSNPDHKPDKKHYTPGYDPNRKSTATRQDYPLVTKRPYTKTVKPHHRNQPHVTHIPTERTTRYVPKEYPGEPPPDTCDTSYDAIAVIRKELFIFKDRYFWRIGDNGLVEKNYPAEITRLWKDFPKNLTHIDAVYERPDGHIAFFIGDKYYLFAGLRVVPGYPKPITDLGLPVSLKKIDGAMVWGHNGQTYFYSGDMYWRFDESVQKVELDYPRNMAMWNGVGTDIDAVFQWKDGRTYFFKGKGFWKFNDQRMSVEHVEQKPSGPFWMGCKQNYEENGLNQKLPYVNLASRSHKTDLKLWLIILFSMGNLILKIV